MGCGAGKIWGANNFFDPLKVGAKVFSPLDREAKSFPHAYFLGISPENFRCYVFPYMFHGYFLKKLLVLCGSQHYFTSNNSKPQLLIM